MLVGNVSAAFRTGVIQINEHGYDGIDAKAVNDP